ncbi:MAG: CRP-like cAMP-binding protein [Bradymonadia bacterium]|jgi:CRP-like cAMP-binding protein
MSEFPTTLLDAALFAKLDDLQRATFVRSADSVALAAGETLYNADEAATGLYVLVAGTMCVIDPLLTSLGEAGGSHIDRAGSLLSPGSLLESYSHRHSVKAATDATLLHLARAKFETLFEQGNPLAFRLLDFLVQDIGSQVRELNRAIQDVLSES